VEIVNDFYLAGGTALALQYGHRESVDFDFFREQPFGVEVVLNALNEKTKTEVRVKQENTLLVLINDITCSFFRYPYPMLRQTLDFKKNVKLASTPDIAAMKISAMSIRGTKRDFVDLFFICKREFRLSEVLQFYQKKFGQWNDDMYHVYKSLTYFNDAEGDPMPVMFERTDWKEVKTFFQNEFTQLMKNLKQGLKP
jgi:hypothetical protein